ncbi:MAG TPA: hypothetical protein VHE59_05875 [Mucilaginibacter sp.]|nr:hypothetical protein [Mucilaginibacter sp.]
MKSKQIIILAFLCIGLSNLSRAQDFYKDYRKYLIGNGKATKKRVSLIDTSIKRLRLTINHFKHDKKKSFFLTDTIFMVNFQGVETGALSMIIWTKHTCCFYRYTYGLANWKKINEKFTINTSAFDILKSFNKAFRDAIEKGDTSAYHKYADTHGVLDGQWITSVITIKKNGRWQFLRFNDDGRAINYGFEPPKK